MLVKSFTLPSSVPFLYNVNSSAIAALSQHKSSEYAGGGGTV